MSTLHFFISLLPAIGALAMLFVVAFAFSGPALPGRRAFGVLALFTGLWCSLASAEYFALDFETRRIFASLSYVGIVGVPVAWLIFACRYAGLDRWITRGSGAALALVPLTTLVLVASNGYHGLIWTSAEMVLAPLPNLEVEHGWFFNYVHTPYSYLLMLAGVVVLVSRFFADLTANRGQLLGVVLTAVLVLVSNVGYVIGDLDLFGIDPTPLTLALCTLGIAASIFRGFLGSAPLSYRQVFVAAQEGVIMLDSRGCIVDINPAGTALSRDGNPVGKSLRDEFPWLFSDGGATEPAAKAWYLEKLYSIRCVELGDAGDRTVGQALLLQDMTAEHHERAVLEELARIDSLTGALNRGAFTAAVTVRLQRRPQDCPLAVLFIDLNGFKKVNDRFGHSVGDFVLRETARRIEQRLRPGDALGRIGGDEFVVLLDRASPDIAELLSNRIAEVFETPFVTADAQCRLGASIGFAIWPEDGNDADSLLIEADRRMYAIKHGQRGATIHHL